MNSMSSYAMMTVGLLMKMKDFASGYSSPSLALMEQRTQAVVLALDLLLREVDGLRVLHLVGLDDQVLVSAQAIEGMGVIHHLSWVSR